MIDTQALKQAMQLSSLAAWSETLDDDLKAVMSERDHGDEKKWQPALDALPDIESSRIDMRNGTIKIYADQPLVHEIKHELQQNLEAFIPWRKGPFNIHGIHIDTEWRSDLKWERLKYAITDLRDRVVLDVGCGSGYHGWRMAEAGAKLVIGIDPGRLFYYQYQVVKHFLRPQSYPFFMLPMGIQHVPANLQAFDTVFSMGILYHRKSPLDHLSELKACLKPGGELVLETIIVDGEEGYSLVPEGRYSKMRNVWFIPSIPTLIAWMRRTGYKNISLIDESVTTPEEQRATHWMRFESLSDFLDADDPTKTVEGYPAPKRAVIIATA
ncbi:MAG: tRNA 5-methoxyuridine(34)/uridine 5-oxyacetic acid(34) synthase CmoB [Gammaproteobacteria bacterium]|nr:tRNA 5-methoxyuridine(34)/uridine 5-oxyacetic acid(34) synthase CmoB [Gammaproteobacteria bacterium]